MPSNEKPEGEAVIPRRINPITGRLEKSPEEVEKFKPIWKKLWQEYSALDDEMIKYVIEKVRCSPLTWPGSVIAKGSVIGVNKFATEIADEWQRAGRQFTGSQLYREAKRRLNEYVRRRARASAVEDPFAFEYFLPTYKRKKPRYV